MIKLIQAMTSAKFNKWINQSPIKFSREQPMKKNYYVDHGNTKSDVERDNSDAYKDTFISHDIEVLEQMFNGRLETINNSMGKTKSFVKMMILPIGMQQKTM
jgi:hypothetical protein